LRLDAPLDRANLLTEARNLTVGVLDIALR
jgi:hypothetical protein